MSFGVGIGVTALSSSSMLGRHPGLALRNHLAKRKNGEGEGEVHDQSCIKMQRTVNGRVKEEVEVPVGINEVKAGLEAMQMDLSMPSIVMPDYEWDPFKNEGPEINIHPSWMEEMEETEPTPVSLTLVFVLTI